MASQSGKDSLRKALLPIRAIVFDVDGTLATGSIMLVEHSSWIGNIKVFCAKDASPIKAAVRQDISVFFITGRPSPAVERRAQELGAMLILKERVRNASELCAFLKQNCNVSKEQVAYVGDDLNDLPFTDVGCFIATADAVTEVKAVARLILQSCGGEGVGAEVVRHICNAKGIWDKVLNGFRERLR